MGTSAIVALPRYCNGLVNVWIIYSIVSYSVGISAASTPDNDVLIPPVNPQIQSLHIKSEVTYRFATTQVTSRLANVGESAKEATFSVTLPESAFIMNFSMVIDGSVLLGKVKEKKTAKKQYDKAKKKGHSAGLVASDARDSSVFKVSINVAPQSKVDFNLTYQELLQRKLGVYEHLININPGQVVRDMSIEVDIRESREITVLRVPPIRENAVQILDPDQVNPYTEIKRLSPTSAKVRYSPTMQQQLAISPQGIAGQFIVQYDVMRGLNAGEIQVIDGYFVHYIAPSGLEAVNKNILFVLDVSGSMFGTKLAQVKTAMITILDDLRSSDVFNIVKFSSQVRFWKSKAVLATPLNIDRAKEFINNLIATGGTNINDALLKATEFPKQLEEFPLDNITRPSLTIFLTDGEPTSGVTSPASILDNVRNANPDKRISIFSLGFGKGANFPLLQKLSLQNDGIARKIYEDSDASLQLQGFYSEVATPLLADVKVRYTGDSVEDGSLTSNTFPVFFQGSEMVVVGKLKNTVNNFQVEVYGGSAQGDISLDMDVSVPEVEKEASRNAPSQFTERLWAYLTIRKLLDEMLEAVDPEEAEAAKAKAIELSVKYNFVTPLTSMVVTKPKEKKLKPDDRSNDKSPTPTQSPASTSKPNSFAGYDPHFLIGIGDIEERVCFDINGNPGDFYQLLHDNSTGIVVNAMIVANKRPTVSGQYKTFFGEIGIVRNKMKIRVSPTEVIMMGKRISWHKSSSVTFNDVTITVEKKKWISVNMGRGVVFRIVRRLEKASHPTKVSFLGFYIEESSGMSQLVHGLLGQFVNQKGIVNVINGGSNNSAREIVTAEVTLQGPHQLHRSFTATLGRRRDMTDNVHVPCWHVRNNGRGFIKGHHTGYLVPSLFHTKPAVALKNAQLSPPKAPAQRLKKQSRK